MAMYTIIHVDKSWIVCTVQGKLIVFDRKSLALRTAHEAEELLRASEERGQANSAVNPRSGTTSQNHSIGFGKLIVRSQ